MGRSSKYGIRELHKNFPTNKACLEFIFDSVHGRECTCGGVYKLKKGCRKFQCSRCRSVVAPTAKTIFHKSQTPLVLWFHAVMLFSNAKSGISGKELERNLGVTYKCAWRMLNLIRSSLKQGLKMLSGIVETDGAYLGGKKSGLKDFKSRSEAILSKPVVMAAIERGGRAKAQVVQGTGAIPTGRFVTSSVDLGARLLSDRHGSYERLNKLYDRRSVNHSKKEYVRGNTHVNSVESFWSHVKRSIKGTHKSVSKQHLQSYLDAFVFHYDNGHNDRRRFETLLQLVLLSAKR